MFGFRLTYFLQKKPAQHKGHYETYPTVKQRVSDLQQYEDVLQLRRAGEKTKSWLLAYNQVELHGSIASKTRTWCLNNSQIPAKCPRFQALGEQ